MFIEVSIASLCFWPRHSAFSLFSLSRSRRDGRYQFLQYLSVFNYDAFPSFYIICQLIILSVVVYSFMLSIRSCTWLAFVEYI